MTTKNRELRHIPDYPRRGNDIHPALLLQQQCQQQLMLLLR